MKAFNARKFCNMNYVINFGRTTSFTIFGVYCRPETFLRFFASIKTLRLCFLHLNLTIARVSFFRNTGKLVSCLAWLDAQSKESALQLLSLSSSSLIDVGTCADSWQWYWTSAKSFLYGSIALSDNNLLQFLTIISSEEGISKLKKSSKIRQFRRDVPDSNKLFNQFFLIEMFQSASCLNHC